MKKQNRSSVPSAVMSTVIICITPLFGGECDNWQTAHPEWIWCDCFESGNALSASYQDISANGMSVVSGEAFEGTHSLRQAYTQGQVDAGWIIRVDNNGFPDHLFLRWYHKFEPGFQGFPPKMARIRHRTRSGDWTSSYAVHCWIETDGVVALDVVARNSTQANSEGWLPIARTPFSFATGSNIGRWVCFEMEVRLNAPGAKDGLYRLWADDSLIAERTNVDLRGSTAEKINEIMIDCYWNGGSPKAQSRYYDNFVVSSQKIGRMTNIAVQNDRRVSMARPASKPHNAIIVADHRSMAIGKEPFFDIHGRRILTGRTIPAGVVITAETQGFQR